MLGEILAALALVSTPVAVNGGAFSRTATSIWHGGATVIPSPNGEKAILVRPPKAPASDETHEVVVRAYGREFPTDVGALVNAEAAWAPDSSAFFVTFSDGGNVGTYHVKVFFGNDLGDKLLNAEDAGVTRPDTRAPRGARP